MVEPPSLVWSPHEDPAWFFATLALMGLYGLWVGTRHYGWHALLPLDTALPSKGAEDEALGCVMADSARKFGPEVEFLAGRAALRRIVEMRK